MRNLKKQKGITITIIIREKDKWQQVSSLIKTSKIDYVNARLVKNGVEFHPNMEDDYRRLYRTVNSISYSSTHTNYPLKSRLRLL